MGQDRTATIATDRHTRSRERIVSPSLSPPGLRMSSFWVCHRSILSYPALTSGRHGLRAAPQPSSFQPLLQSRQGGEPWIYGFTHTTTLPLV